MTASVFELEIWQTLCLIVIATAMVVIAIKK